MVKKGRYQLASQGLEGGAGAARGATDYSFGACILSMLVFLAICIIIIAATYPWMKDKNQVY
jgi:hypothetical protein